jgi:hypothetical protein
VDWTAALWAGVLSGVLFILLNLVFIPIFIGGNVWVVIRLFASILLGEGVLAPPATFDPGALLVALLTNLLLSVLYALLLSFIIHRGGLIGGIVGGAVFGVALFGINFFTLTYFFPWFFAMRNWVFVVAHIIYGAVTGGVYEALEIEEYVPVEE